MKRIARVFPRKTNATPIDEYAFIDEPGLFVPEDIEEVHVSVTFTWDIPRSERLAEIWARRTKAPTYIGGPAMYGEHCRPENDVFIRGRYLREGYVITSRGCPNRCWFCLVPQREGGIRELPIVEGSNVLDNNLLACSEGHIRSVFRMLETQAAAKLSGGLESRLLKPWHVELFEKARIKEAFFAYDAAGDWEPLTEAAKILKTSAWYRPHKARCYILCGYPGDTLAKAEKRCRDTLMLGFYPFAMFYRDEYGAQKKNQEWSKFQITWTRPPAINATARRLGLNYTRTAWNAM